MEIVYPGEIIANEIEYLNKQNTTVDDEGNIIATAIGKVVKDQDKKIVYVKGKDKQIRVGDIVEGKVFDVKEKMILVLINKVFNKKGEEKRNYIGMAAVFMANISISYVEDIKDVAKIGDIIRAEIISIKPGVVDLSMKGPDYGVVLAFCSKCRHKLHIQKPDFKYRDFSIMYCENCKHIEKRKTSKYYVYKR